MNIGDQYIWKPFNHAEGRYHKEHVWYGHIVTVIEFDIPDKVWVSVDDFPECNHREHKNRFLVDKKELFEATMIVKS